MPTRPPARLRDVLDEARPHGQRSAPEGAARRREAVVRGALPELHSEGDIAGEAPGIRDLQWEADGGLQAAKPQHRRTNPINFVFISFSFAKKNDELYCNIMAF